MIRKKNLLFGALATGALTIGIVGGTVAGGVVASTEVADQPKSVAYPVNENGDTFGSAAAVSDPSNEPDLIRVLATNGKEGYAKKADLDAGAASNPEEAREQAANAATAEDRSVPVYANDGETVIGEFVIQAPEGSISKG